MEAAINRSTQIVARGGLLRPPPRADRKKSHATIRSGAVKLPSSRMTPGKGVDSGNPRVWALACAQGARAR
jgi:hypothetical protein